MGSIRLYGSTSGYLELQAPAVAPDAVLTLPSDSVQPGLVHLHTETFSAVSSVSLDGCFTSAYENYELRITFTTSTAAELNFRFRVSGTDTTTGYYQSRIQGAFNSTSLFNANASNDSKIELAYDSGIGSSAILTIMQPQTTAKSSVYGQGMNRNTTGNGRVIQGFVDNATQYDGFTLVPVTGTISGTLRVYGYRNA